MRLFQPVKLFWKRLEKENIITNVRTVGKAMMYILDLSNPVVKKFRDLYWETTRQKVHEKLREKEFGSG